MQRKKSMIPKLTGVIEAHAALLENLLSELRARKLMDDAALDSVFAHARADFTQARKVASQGEVAHTALETLEQMQSRVLGRSRSFS